MYSWEIDNLLKTKRYFITPDDYKNIVIGSPQLNLIKYEPNTDDFIIATEDNYSWRFKVDSERKER